MKKKRKATLLLFKSSSGKRVRLPDDLTIEDMAKMGITIRLTPKGQPIRKHEYVHIPNTMEGNQ